jgi:hypothetical protein
MAAVAVMVVKGVVKSLRLKSPGSNQLTPDPLVTPLLNE